MRPDEWNEIRGLLDEALRADPAGRAALLDERCAERPELRRAVEEMLQACDHASSILESWNPETEETTVLGGEDQRYLPGTPIGHFRIRELIGEGAFGEVYAADQTGEIKRRVALKILKPGLDSRSVVARFELERQIVALVDHPNIAKIFEAGTTPSGRPYFAMEFVSGVPITQHCDNHRLGIRARLELFAELCDALQHAHQKGIIHRDVKPTNILVEYAHEKAVPKIIDFGVAKALNRPLTDHTVYTQAGQLVGTFAYMSPEQARLTTQDVDTRSDIYSLGVLLYELLTGLKPLDDETLREAALDEKLRLIREQEPARPSTRLTSGAHTIDTADCARRRRTNLHALTRVLQGDLDWITLCALEKDRGRRYKSASEFAADIRHYLADEPISVGPPSVGYRLGKFVRRHRAAVIAAGLMAVVLLLATVATTASVVNGRRAQADAGRLQARDLVEQAKLLSYQYPDQAWALLEDAAAKDPGNPDVQVEMSRVEWRQGKAAEALKRVESVVERNPRSGRAAALVAGLTAADDPERSRRHRAAAEQLLAGAELHYALGIAEVADRRKAVEHFSTALSLNPWMFDALWERGVRLSDLGAQGKEPEPAKLDLEAALRDADLAALVRAELPMTQVLRGSVLLRLRLKENDAAARAIAEANERKREEDVGRLREEIAATSAQRVAEAIEALDRAIEIGADWIAYFNRGLAHVAAGEQERALADFDAGLKLAPREIRLLKERGWALLRLRRFSDAIEPFRSAIELEGKSVDRLWDLADAYYNDGKMREADELFTEIVGILPESRSDALSYLLTDRGYARMRLERHPSAEEDFRQALTVDDGNAQTWVNLCQVLWRQGRYPESIEPCERAAELRPGQALFAVQRGMAYWFNGRLAEASRDFEAYLKSGGDDVDWVRVWHWSVRSMMGPTGASPIDSATVENPAVRAFARYTAGAATEEDVLSAAASDKDRFVATVFIGLHHQVHDRSAEARVRLESSLEMGFSSQLESDIALWALGRE